ncbi:Aquaporin Z 2 [Planctomycetes bacterium MalM25]|nr:Aquaporin Z 2 [Planctomycetes bacterium MalM25]
MKRYLAEAIGTYALVFAGTGAIIVDGVTDGSVSLVGVALVFGLVVMAMIYALGDISGAHLNPAVTIAACVAKRFPAQDVGPYIAAQCIGALAASASLKAIYPGVTGLGATMPLDGNVTQSFILEVILTFFLVFVALGVTTAGRAEGILAGLAIGGTVGLDVFVGGPISGASMNPARSFGPAVISGQTQHLWMYLAAPVAGGILAAIVTNCLRSEEPTESSD